MDRLKALIVAGTLMARRSRGCVGSFVGNGNPPPPPPKPPPWICFSQVQRNLISLDLDWTGFEAPQTPADAHDARPLPSPDTR